MFFFIYDKHEYVHMLKQYYPLCSTKYANSMELSFNYDYVGD